jgi:hypothetical protein
MTNCTYPKCQATNGCIGVCSKGEKQLNTDYTLEIYRIDKRTKSGRRRVGTYDYKNVSERWITEEIRELQRMMYHQSKYVIEMHETWITRKNLLSGEKFAERYDTPYYCSPSSETYWSS